MDGMCLDASNDLIKHAKIIASVFIHLCQQMNFKSNIRGQMYGISLKRAFFNDRVCNWIVIGD